MKIGILTYHRTLNYGGCLQALATRLYLENLGHEVYYVDYWPDYHKRAYSVFNKDVFMKRSWKGKLRYIQSTLKSFPYILKRQKVFKIYHRRFTIPFCKPLDEQYDVIIYGSDQIWRKQNALNDYNPVYFGENNFLANKHIAFSASMGVLPDSRKEGQRIASMLNHFNKISVREDSLSKYLKGLGVCNIEQTIDPTLLLDSNGWNEVLESKPYTGKKYILIYALWGDVFNMDSIQALAKKENLIIKTLRGVAEKKDTETEISIVDPIEFVRLIKNAEYVFSSSFHGLVFSIIYHKQVFVSFNINGGRAQSLLSAAGIPNRYLDNYQPFSSDVSKIDYEEVDKRIELLRKSSKDFLVNITSY